MPIVRTRDVHLEPLPLVRAGELCIVLGNPGRLWDRLKAQIAKEPAYKNIAVRELLCATARGMTWQQIESMVDALRSASWRGDDGTYVTFLFVELPPSGQAKNEKLRFEVADIPYSRTLFSHPAVVWLLRERPATGELADDGGTIEVMKDRFGDSTYAQIGGGFLG